MEDKQVWYVNIVNNFNFKNLSSKSGYEGPINKELGIKRWNRLICISQTLVLSKKPWFFFVLFCFGL